jgi:hypothetical protein
MVTGMTEVTYFDPETNPNKLTYNSTLDPLFTGVSGPACVLVRHANGESVVVLGGRTGASTASTQVVVYTANVSASSTPSVPQAGTDDLSIARGTMAVASSGQYVAFAGGRDDRVASNAASTRVDVFSGGSHFGTTELASSRFACAGAASPNVEGIAVIGGGTTNLTLASAASDKVDFIMLSTPSRLASLSLLSQPRYFLAATGIQDWVVFAGGEDPDTTFGAVDLINVTSRTLFSVDALPGGNRTELAACTAAHNGEQYAFFAGGMTSRVAYQGSNKIDILKGSDQSWLARTIGTNEPFALSAA